MEEDWMNYEMLLECGILMATAELMEETGNRRRSKYRVNPYLRERGEKGRFVTDFENLKREPRLFIENFRMSADTFDELYEMLEPHLLPKRHTRPLDFIPAKAKLAIVLEYMASGDLKRHVASCYRISKQHFGTIVSLVCEAICSVLKIPKWTEEIASQIADEFHSVWNFPNCVGAMDGKHVSLKAPPNSGSLFYNYKGFHSIVLLGMCDASYKFTYVDVGAYGSEGDCNVLKNSKFGAALINDTFLFPPDADVGNTKLPYFIVGDDAFPLCKRIMKPYTTKPLQRDERIFNYRLSRAKRCIENAFGILSGRWLCLRKMLFCSPDRAQGTVLACCLLHNFLIIKNQSTYCPTTFIGSEQNGVWVEGDLESTLQENQNICTTYRGRSSDYGKYIRNSLKHFVNSSSGSVPWQDTVSFL